VNLPTEVKNDQVVVGISNYRDEFGKKHTELEHPKKFKDNLHTGGPMAGTTTYKQNFIPKSSPSQYVSDGLRSLQSTRLSTFPWARQLPVPPTTERPTSGDRGGRVLRLSLRT